MKENNIEISSIDQLVPGVFFTDVIYKKCCGLDVHKKLIVACVVDDTKAEGYANLRLLRNSANMPSSPRLH
jgi:hypothetical protein